MALSNIEIKIIGDYIWNEDLQIYHEKINDDFVYYFKDWLENLVSIPKTINVNINVDYHVNQERFVISYISTREKELLQALKDDNSFSDKYFLKL
ncbi:hypothetical protein [Flavobacterium sp. ASV13]|uniref:hypothetical protein n=1 Tax=Flavobacterium sp. ASV13 TaxID=1506583 RepID=UPI00054CD9D7|nr:hypothetical protein [Flavobacterium sp. ASV13]